MALEPWHHEGVECVRMFDIREMARVSHFLIATARNFLRDQLVAGRWRALIIVAADHEGGGFDGRQVIAEIEIQNGRPAAEIAGGRRAGNGRMYLAPAGGIAGFEGVREPTLHRAVSQGGDGVGLARQLRDEGPRRFPHPRALPASCHTA